MDFPKVLVISNNCFSNSGSNGRTLANFFLGWPKEKLAQFYIHNEYPDFEGCNNYFRLTDKEVIKGIISNEIVGEKISSVTCSNNEVLQQNKRQQKNKLSIKKTTATMLGRNFIWNLCKFRKTNFNTWVKDFKPDVLLLQAGDAPFMLKIARNLSKENKIPLIIYNSEDYYFKKYNYMNRSKNISPLYFFFHAQLKKEYKKTMSGVKYAIYNTPLLCERYLKEFDHDASVIMTSTQLEPTKLEKEEKDFKIVYLGNLGVGRHETLIQFANVLQEIGEDYRLDVYGQAPNEYIKRLLNECESINYHGKIPYESVIKQMQKSDVLIHVENFNEFYIEDLRYAFSTKIADSLSSGRCFFVYASEKIASTQYLLNNDACHVVTSFNKLKATIEEVIYSKESREKYLLTQYELAKKNHNIDVNRLKFQKIIINCCKSQESN